MNVRVPHSTGVEMQESGLQVSLKDGQAAYFNYYWLRDNSPTSFDSQTKERVFDIFQLADAPEPETAAIVDGALEVSRKNDGHASRYPLDLLAQYSEGKRRSDPADLTRRAWY